MYIKTNLTEEQKVTLQKVFRCGFTQPHVVAQQLHIKRVEAIALLDRLALEHPQQFTRKYLVYHTCSEAPVASIYDTKVFGQGWICPECEEEVELDDLNLDFTYNAIAPVDFVNPDDGLVRYWGFSHFPYYVKTCRHDPEPALILTKEDADSLDLIIELESEKREKALYRLEQEYREAICGIVEGQEYARID